ncbi:MAG: SPFH domain-containing protein, partial [Weissella confusa]|nr:SPFH domain-containing protein [Weissella confusa]
MMILFSVLIVLLLIILAFVVFTGIRIIPQNMVGMVSVLGKYQRQIEPGFHVVMPFITRVDSVD